MLVRLPGLPRQTALMRNQAVPDGLHTETSTLTGLDNRVAWFWPVRHAAMGRSGARAPEHRDEHRKLTDAQPEAEDHVEHDHEAAADHERGDRGAKARADGGAHAQS